MNDDYYMSLALDQAQQAFDQGEFPVGCVIVHQGNVVAHGARTGTADCVGGLCRELSHAEMNALSRLETYKLKKNEKLTDLVLYSTLEPCLMCYAASALSGIRRIVFAYEDVMGGGLSCNFKHLSPLYRDCRMQLTGGVKRDESIRLFCDFFGEKDNSYWNGSLLALYTLEQKGS